MQRISSFLEGPRKTGIGSRSLVPVIVLLVLLATAHVASAQFGNLVNRVPDDANAMLLIDVDKLLASPMAQDEGWRAKLDQAFSAGLVILPPQAGRFMLSARLDFRQLRPLWRVAVLDVKYEPSIPKAAVRYGGQIDNIDGLDAALMPDDAYLVKFGPKLVGAMSPGDRQKVARWINQIHANDIGVLSPYMQQAVKYAESSAGLILALDLHHVVAPADAKARLVEWELLKDRNIDPDQVAEVLASVRGVMLGVTVTDKRYGAIRVDFDQDASVLQDIAKPLLLEVLGRHGLMIDEFQDWTAEVNGKTIALRGVLNASGMRRVLSILDAPASAQQNLASPSETDPEAADKQLVIVSSQTYFKSIESLLDDLRIKRSSSEFVTWGQVGAWFEKYARKIDGMPILHVDPELLDYGAYVANSLRDAENSMKGIGMRSGYRKTELPTQYNYNVQAGAVGGWGPYGAGVRGGYRWTAQEDLSAEFADRAHVRTQEKIQGNVEANHITQGIAQSTAEVRRRMTEKYQVEF
jgi:hypothetical protein